MTLLERGPALEALERALGEVAHGEGRVALVYGEAGIGKTSLVDSFARARGQPGRMLWGGCDSLHTPRPLGPVHDIAQQAAPALLARLEAGAPPRAIFAAVLEELRHRPPVIAVFEDLHWADAATLDLIKFLGRRIRQVPALLVLTYRDDELGPRHPLRIALGDLATSAVMRRIPLPPLSVAAVRTLATGQPLDAAALHRQTGGNPFFVTEALASRETGIPVTVRDAVLARAARLSPAGRTTLDAAAIIGSQVEPWLLAALVGDATAATEECIALGMLRAQGDLLAFRHELARQAVLDTIAPPARPPRPRAAGARVPADRRPRSGAARRSCRGRGRRPGSSRPRARSRGARGRARRASRGGGPVRPRAPLRRHRAARGAGAAPRRPRRRVRDRGSARRSDPRSARGARPASCRR